MSRAKHEDNRIIVSKDQFESSLNDEGGCSGSSLAGETVLKRGPWTSLEDAILVDYVEKHGKGNWNAVRKHTGLSRCGKSCRLRWANHLRPDLKKGAFSHEEEKKIIYLHSKLGNKWAQMAACIPGRTDNEIKNYWNTRAKKQHRAGLPLYPQHALLEASNENLHALNNNLSFNPGMNCAEQSRESESYFPGSHGGMASGHTMFEQLPHELGSVNNNLPSLCYSKPDSLMIQPNGNFSTSSPLTGTAELELPSLQYPETFYCRRPTCPPAAPYEATHTYIQSPLVTASAQSDCAASPSSGLLDTLVQESHAISTVRKQSSEKRSNYSAISPGDMPENSTANMCGAEWEGSSDLNSPFCRSAVSPFSECAPISNCSLDELPDLKGALGLEMTELGAAPISASNSIEKDISDWLDVLSPDALLGSGWYTGASEEEPHW